MSAPIPVAILGATGMVGQRLISLLAGHPRFQIAAVCASQRSAGRPWADATRWRLPGEPPHEVLNLPVRRCDPSALPGGVRLVLSALGGGVAGPIEQIFADAGCGVVTNASAHRMNPEVPLVIPDVNPDHLRLLDARTAPGFIVANPNCCTIPLCLALAPLHDAFGVEAVTVATWQAVSGAGYPGESAWDMVGTVHPHAGDEEEKLAAEPLKILGAPGRPIDVPISARCVRVPVADGHLLGIHARLQGGPDVAAVTEALVSWQGAGPELRSLPRPPLRLTTRRDRPSPRLDLDAGCGMAITIGRVEPCPVMGVKFYALGHNTVRGAAGAAIANAELLVETGRLSG